MNKETHNLTRPRDACPFTNRDDDGGKKKKARECPFRARRARDHLIEAPSAPRVFFESGPVGSTPPGPACVSSTRRAAANYLRAGRPSKSLTARARRRLSGGNLTVDAARYVPSSSSNKQATALPPAPLHRTTAAAAATALTVGDGGCGRRRASAATVVGCGTSTAARARPWRGLGRVVRIVSAARRAQGTHRIRQEVLLFLLREISER